MATVDVGIPGLEFDVPNDWGESQVQGAIKTRYPFLFPELVEASRRAGEVAPVPGPIEIAPGAMQPSETLPPLAPPEPAPTPTPPPLVRPPAPDAAEAYYREKFPQPTQPTLGTPSFLEAVAKEYARTVGTTLPSLIQSARLADAALGTGAAADFVSRGPEALAESEINKRVESARNLDALFELARNYQGDVEKSYDYNRNYLPAYEQKPAEWIGSGLGSATVFLPSAVLGPVGPLALGAGMSFAPAYEQARAKGASPKAALRQAAIEAATEAASEYFLGVPGMLARRMSKPAVTPLRTGIGAICVVVTTGAVGSRGTVM